MNIRDIQMNDNVQKAFKRVDAMKARGIIAKYLNNTFEDDQDFKTELADIVSKVRVVLPEASASTIFVALLQESNKNYWNVTNDENKNIIIELNTKI